MNAKHLLLLPSLMVTATAVFASSPLQKAECGTIERLEVVLPSSMIPSMLMCGYRMVSAQSNIIRCFICTTVRICSMLPPLGIISHGKWTSPPAA